MEKLTRCFLSVLLLVVVMNFVSAEDKFFGEGGELLLSPPFYGRIINIMWKRNYDQVAEWEKGEVYVHYYNGYDGRTTLNTTTASLEIRNMSPADIGVYSVDINYKVQPERYNAKLIKVVQKPTVLVKPLNCATASENCTLTCDGNTEKAEPVTYSWKMGEGEWMDGEKNRSITNDETIQSVETFSCKMKNPISEEESKTEPNPFFREKVSGVGMGVGLFLLVVIAALGIVGFWKREYIKKIIYPSKPQLIVTHIPRCKTNEARKATTQHVKEVPDLAGLREDTVQSLNSLQVEHDKLEEQIRRAQEKHQTVEANHPVSAGPAEPADHEDPTGLDCTLPPKL